MGGGGAREEEVVTEQLWVRNHQLTRFSLLTSVSAVPLLIRQHPISFLQFSLLLGEHTWKREREGERGSAETGATAAAPIDHSV